MQRDAIWRDLVNTLPELDENGADPPTLEIMKKKLVRKFNVQKVITEIYIWTDIDNHQFNEAVNQDLVLLGEMTESQIKKLLKAEARRKNAEG